MKRHIHIKICCLVSILCFSFGSFAQSPRNDTPAKGEFYKASNQQSAINKSGNVYSANAQSMASQWQSQGFFLDNSKRNVTFGTGNYEANSLYTTVSPVINLPDINENEKIYLEIKEKFKTESNYDQMSVKISTDRGMTWETLNSYSGKTNWRTNTFRLNRYAGKSIQIAFNLQTDASIESDGWEIANVEVFISRPKPPAKGANEQARVRSIEILEVYTENYPEAVFVDFTALNENGDFVSGLVMNDIFGTDNSDEISTCTKLVEGNAGLRQSLDVVFLMDNSGSMDRIQNSTRDNVMRIIDDLVEHHTPRFALVRFGQSNNGTGLPEGAPLVEPNPNMPSSAFWDASTTSRADAFKQFWTNTNTSVWDDWYEPSYWAIHEALTNPLINFEDFSEKIIILITNEHVSSGANQSHISKSDALNILLANRARLYTIGEDYQWFRDDFEDLCIATNGKYSPHVSGTFDDIFDDLVFQITNKYTLRYCPTSPLLTSNPNDCVELMLRLQNHPQYSDNTCYYPTPLPHIVRTPATQALDGVTQPNNREVPVGVEILTSEDLTGVTVSFHYRTITGSGGLPDFRQGNNLSRVPGTNTFTGIIPYYEVLPHNIEYYFVAHFPNNRKVKSPTESPDLFAWSFPVDPNLAPVISNVEISPASISPCQSITIEADIFDDTEELITTKLFFKPNMSHSGWIIGDMVDIGRGRYSYTIEDEFVDIEGLSYFIYAQDNYRTQGWHGTIESPLQLIPQVGRSTYAPMLLMITDVANVVVQCQTMTGDDEIYAYFINDCGQMEIGGVGVIDPNLDFIPVLIYGNDPANLSRKDGWNSGEEVFLKLRRDGMEFDLTYTWEGSPNPLIYMPNQGKAIFALEGQGQARIEVRGNGVVIENNDLFPSTNDFTDFGYVSGNNDATRTYFIHNRGCSPLQVSSVSVTDGFNFGVRNYPSTAIVPGGIGYITIEYKRYIPAQTTVTIVNNGGVNPFKFNIAATNVNTSQSFTMYPNPVSSGDAGVNVDWEIPQGSRQSVDIMVFDIFGNLKAVPLRPYVYVEGNYTMFIDTYGWTPGSYIVQVSIGGTPYTQTLIIN